MKKVLLLIIVLITILLSLGCDNRTTTTKQKEVQISETSYISQIIEEAENSHNGKNECLVGEIYTFSHVPTSFDNMQTTSDYYLKRAIEKFAKKHNVSIKIMDSVSHEGYVKQINAVFEKNPEINNSKDRE